MYKTFFFSRINDLLLKLPVTSEELCGLYDIKCWEVLVYSRSCHFKSNVTTQLVCSRMKECIIFSLGDGVGGNTIYFLDPENLSYCSDCRFLISSFVIILSVSYEWETEPPSFRRCRHARFVGGWPPVVSRGSWRLTGHQLYSPLDHVHAFLHVCLVFLQYWKQRVFVTRVFFVSSL